MRENTIKFIKIGFAEFQDYDLKIAERDLVAKLSSFRTPYGK